MHNNWYGLWNVHWPPSQPVVAVYGGPVSPVVETKKNHSQFIGQCKL